MAGKLWQLESEVAGHTVSKMKKQKMKTGHAQRTFFLFKSFSFFGNYFFFFSSSFNVYGCFMCACLYTMSMTSS